MADKPVTTNVSANAQYLAATLNDNFATIEDAIEGCLGRGGTSESPNSMTGVLDMDLNKIQNLGAPSANYDAIRLIDLSDSDATGAASAQLRLEVVPKDSVAALKASSLDPGTFIGTKGYTTVGDGGNATYLIVSSGDYVGTPDGYGDHYDAAGNVAVLQITGNTLYAKQYGLIEGQDNTDALQAAINKCSSIKGTLIIDGDFETGEVTAKSDVTIILNGRLYTDGTYGVFIFSMLENPFSELTYYDIDNTTSYLSGSKTITMDTGNGSYFSPGDRVWIRCKGLLTGTEEYITPVAEVNVVHSVSGDDVTFVYPLSKDYEYDSNYSYGVALVGENFIENFHIKSDGNGILENYGARPIDIRSSFKTSVSGVIIRGIGAGVIRGKESNIYNNVIELIPDWASGWRPYYWAWDTGQSDSSFHDNYCISEGMGIMHIHEGCGNCAVYDNTFEQGLTDIGTSEEWSVISLLTVSWDTLIARNRIVNGPLENAINVRFSSKYTTEGHKRLKVIDNFVGGQFVNYGISLIGVSTDREWIISGNNIDGNFLGTGNYELYLFDVYNAIITNNSLESGTFSISETTSINSLISENWNVSDNKRVFFGINDFYPLTGTPARTAWRTNRNLAFAFDATTFESITGTFLTKDFSIGAIAYVWHTNLGAGSGNVDLVVSYGTFDSGDDADVGDISLDLPGTAAPTQNYVERLAAGTMTLNDKAFMSIRVTRNGAGGTDTLANDWGFIGLELIYK